MLEQNKTSVVALAITNSQSVKKMLRKQWWVDEVPDGWKAPFDEKNVSKGIHGLLYTVMYILFFIDNLP